VPFRSGIIDGAGLQGGPFKEAPAPGERRAHGPRVVLGRLVVLLMVCVSLVCR